MSRCRVLVAVLVGAVLAAGSVLADEEFWAQATFVRGDVTWVAAGGAEAQVLARGAVLHRGDEVRVGADGQASFLQSDGRVVVVRGEHTRVLGPEPEAAPSLGVVASNLSKTLLAREGDNPMLKHLGGMRGDNVALAPRSTKVRPPVRLVWRTVPGVQRYSVSVMGPDASLFETTVEDAALAVPAHRLEPGGTYFWEVRDAADPDTFTALGSGVFNVLDESAQARVATLLEAIDAAFGDADPAADTTPLFLTYQVFREHELRLAALATVERMRAHDPSDPQLERWRADLCGEMNLEPETVEAALAAVDDGPR